MPATLLTIPELAERLRCGPTKARALARKIGITRVGGSVLVSEDRVSAWLSACEEGEEPAKRPKAGLLQVSAAARHWLERC